MKTITEQIEFHTSGVQGKLNYEVVSNAKMMKMLSDSLYQNKIAAPIRELSTNAWDSHVEAGNQNPFEVQLPTIDNPTFKIRDFGMGMAPSKVEKMYRKYGASDKTESNDLQGCMGLGSKSPFAYTSQFVSVTYYNGKKITWVNAKDSRGVPSLNRMSVEDTTEPNGFEVSFAVQKDDVYKFQEEAGDIYAHFPVKPTFIGMEPVIPKYDFVMSGKGWGLKSGQTRYNNRSYSSVIMGYVKYPIETQYFKDNAKEDLHWYQYGSSNANKYIQLLNMGLIIHMDIGEVEMDIGREALQYHSGTINAIKKRLDSILQEIQQQISDRFKQCQNLWEARCLYENLRTGDLRHLNSLCQIAKVVWTDKSGQSYDLTKPISYNNAIIFRKRQRRQIKNTYIAAPPNDDKVGFFVNDVPRGAYAACDREINDSYDIIYLVKFDNDGDKKDFLNQVGIDESRLIYVSTLPKPSKKSRPKSKDVFSFKFDKIPDNIGYYFRIYQYDTHTYWSEEQNVDIDEGGVFLEINNYKPQSSDTACPYHNDLVALVKILMQLKNIGLVVPSLYGIKTSSIDKYRKHFKWVEFHDYIKPSLIKYLQQKGLLDDVIMTQQLDKVDTVNSLCLDLEKVDNPNAHPNSLFYDFVTKVKQLQQLKVKYHTKKNKVEHILLLCELLDIDISKYKCSVSIPQLSGMEQQVLQKYEMLNCLSGYRYGIPTMHYVTNYINLVDSLEGEKS